MFWWWCKWQFAACEPKRQSKLYGDFVMDFVYGRGPRWPNQALDLTRKSPRKSA